MALLKRMDSFDVTYADSFARKELKINEHRVRKSGKAAGKGVGEKRMYMGSDEAELDEFFAFNKLKGFFIQRDDLWEYVNAISHEYQNPRYEYGDGVCETLKILDEYKRKLDGLKEERLYIHFAKTYDSQNRYYLVLPKRCKANMVDHENYSFIRDVCLPRVTRLLFVKFYDDDSVDKDVYIYIKPFFGDRISDRKRSGVQANQLDDERGVARRLGLERYRANVADLYPYCVVTKVTDSNLLMACHIKDYAKCNKSEMYDKYNGFTMTPTIHRLFDLGYLTFDMRGNMVLSDFLRNNDRRCLNLLNTVRINLYEQSLKYLQWHNDNVFIKTSRGIR